MKTLKSTAYGDAFENESIPFTERVRISGDHADIGCARTTEGDCAEILHGLNNVLASVLLNAQVMEWKLPSYSRSKRYLHEIERNAQRGGELVRRLLARLQGECQTDVTDAQDCGEAPTLAGADVAATREPAVLVRAVDVPPRIEAHTAPVFLSSRKKVPHTIV